MHNLQRDVFFFNIVYTWTRLIADFDDIYFVNISFLLILFLVFLFQFFFLTFGLGEQVGEM